MKKIGKKGNFYDLIIIGSGPAGLTAAIYAARANLKVLVLAGSKPGGQLMLTTDVEDFPGYKNIQGPELMEKMIGHAKSFGVDFITDDVEKAELKSKPFKLYTSNNKYQALSVIVATGASARWLGLESEKKLIGRGISACAVCDAPFFRNKDVAVIGGGDTAMREALHLAKVCKSVTIIHRRDQLKAQKVLQDRSFNTKNMKFIWDSVVEAFIGKEKLEAVKLKNVKTNKTTEIKLQGAFIAIGHKPNTEFLKGQVELDDHGYIKLKDLVKTSLDGVFAAGDVHDYKYMQAVTAAGAGCMAALEADNYIESLKEKK